MADKVHLKSTHPDLVAAIEQIPLAVDGNQAKSIMDALLTRVGFAILRRVREAFIAKAHGGADAAGNRWKPLALATIAYSRRGGRTGTEKKRLKEGNARPSSALTAKQRDKWWALYSQGLAMYKGDKGHAAARAWLILKKDGVQTLFDKYSNRQVDILRDTGVLLNSLSPGTDSANQVFKILPGAVIVGTNVPYAAAHHNGTRRIPQRRLWPEPYKWPKSWWDDITEQARTGLVDLVIQLLRR